ncbi:unnamed protein product [Clonostachys rosea]|uniref:Uncharacterized protein n=1 Tax=Bionectria ochroleuca TaxID=29856 RepID=A0ABY6TYW0_BIOOC|nr:unnamed protein product [Clonostachys rosea]
MPEMFEKRERERDSATSDSIGPEGNEKKRQKTESEGADKRGNLASNGRMDALEAELKKLNLNHQNLKRNHLKVKHEDLEETTKIRIEGLISSVSQSTRAANWIFDRLHATMKKADAVATVLTSLWADLRQWKAMPRPTRRPAVVNVTSFGNPNANPERWVK